MITLIMVFIGGWIMGDLVTLGAIYFKRKKLVPRLRYVLNRLYPAAEQPAEIFNNIEILDKVDGRKCNCSMCRYDRANTITIN